MRNHQLSLLKDPRKNSKLWWITKRSVYGGSLNYRKVPRPFDSKKLTHSVFKADLGSALWFTRFEETVREILAGAAARYGVALKDMAVNRDHIHVLYYTKSRESQTRFLRFFSAELGRRYARLRRRMKIAERPLWLARPFTRLVSWGHKSVRRVRDYIRKNRLETLGFITYQPRRHALAGFLEKWKMQPPLSSA